jgi:hypothetical protein
VGSGLNGRTGDISSQYRAAITLLMLCCGKKQRASRSKANYELLVVLLVTQHELELERRKADLVLRSGSWIVDGSNLSVRKLSCFDRPIPAKVKERFWIESDKRKSLWIWLAGI